VQRCGKVTAGQPTAGGSEYLELHGAFSITLRAPGAGLLSVLSTSVTKQTKHMCYREVEPDGS
jgi:hypothetical protein